MTTAQSDPSDPTMWDDRDMTRLSVIHMVKNGEIPPYVSERMQFVGPLTEATEWLNTESGMSAMRMLRRLIEKPIYPAEVEA
jgi:hypothetical protein